MFESLIDARSDRKPFWRPGIVAAAVGLHLAALGTIWVRNLFAVPPIPEPAADVTFARFTPPPPPPAPAPPKPAAPKPVEPKVAAVMPHELVEPEKMPEQVQTTPQPPEAPPADTGVEGGVEGGVPGGVPGGFTQTEPLRVGGEVSPPQILDRAPPEYPPLARSARISGIVILEAIIHRDGTVGDVRILRDLPYGCGQAAVEAIRRWRFKPGELKGEPVDVYYTLTVQFTLK